MTSGMQASFKRCFTGGPVIHAENLTTGGDGSSVTVLFGPSGSGKTTVLRCLAGLDSPDEGRIEFNGQIWFDAARRLALPPRRRRVGFVPQDYALFPHLTIEHNVAYGSSHLSRNERHRRVSEVLHSLGLNGLERRLPGELSGGQQQRVALARAVVWSPQLLLLDEPLSALDAPTRQRLRGELHEWLRTLKIPTLLVTHDRTEALALGNRIIVLNEGRVEQVGPISEVFNRPFNLSVAQIAGVETVVEGRIVARTQGLGTVMVGNVKLQALVDELGDAVEWVYVCIRAEDVVLAQDSTLASSARNRIPGTVESLHHGIPLTRVELNCGFPLKALITPRALEELHLQPGSVITAWVKAPHVHLIPR